MPRTPITFDPKSETHLRELEEANNLDSRSIKKARWIKPVNRRREGQTHAYAIISLASPSSANHLIRKGITICGAKTIPSKLKHEPMQCLRCRGWGHVIAQCLNTFDTCGACGGEHSTNDCNNPHLCYCVSCKNSTHASWDRGCPEFIRRRELYNNRFPENNLHFFPTEEEWTLTTRPDKILFEDCFPQQYTVNSLPMKTAPRCTQQQGQPRNKSKCQNARTASPKGNSQSGSNNNTIDRYFSNSQPNAAAGSDAREEGEPSGPSYLDEPTSNERDLVEQLIGDNMPPGSIPGWI